MNFKIIVTFFFITQAVRLHASYTTNKQKEISKYTFKDYIKKFEPSTIWERIDKRRNLNGEKITKEQEVEEMLTGIDATEELLRVKIPPANLTELSSRRFYRPLSLETVPADPWNYRFRLFELMKQVIFDVRNKMIPTLTMRQIYRTSPLYKMGFLTAKTDRASKTFTKIAYRAFKMCTYKKYERVRNFGIVKTIMMAERLLNLWFDVDLLADVIERNDLNCKEVLRKYSTDRIRRWKWQD